MSQALGYVLPLAVAIAVSCFGAQPLIERRSHLLAVIVQLVSCPGDIAVRADQHGLDACPFRAFVGEPSDGHVESVGARIGRS